MSEKVIACRPAKAFHHFSAAALHEMAHHQRAHARTAGEVCGVFVYFAAALIEDGAELPGNCLERLGLRLCPRS